MTEKKDFDDDFLEIIIDGKIEYINAKSYNEWEVDFLWRQRKSFDKNAYKDDREISKTWNVIKKWLLDWTILASLDEDIQTFPDFISKL